MADADLAALRAIVGVEPTDDVLRLLLRDHSVEAAANRFFDGGALPASTSGSKRPGQPSSDASAEKRAREANTIAAGKSTSASKPLAERMRPTRIDDLCGQGEALDDVLKDALAADRLPSLILWGPPGCGKTSFASCVAGATTRLFRTLSAAKAGVADLREELSRAANAAKLRGARTILFVDEIHRWSKAQQDALLLDVEKGTITLIGATTENPSFTINNAILSRCRLVVFRKVPNEALSGVLDRALGSDPALQGCDLLPDARAALLASADGDARVALNTLELAASVASRRGGGVLRTGDGESSGAARWQVAKEAVMSAVQRRATYYDRNGEFHYDLISALHKSLRGGDADGALYYAARMLAGGEDPRYVTRRLIRFASEDVGLADPNALQQAVAADQACHAIGMPECGVVIGQCAVYLALAPKSCAVYRAFDAAMKAATEEPHCPVPMHIRNAPTKMMSSIGYGKGYVYNPANGYARGCPQGYLPPELGLGCSFFDPADVEPGYQLAFCTPRAPPAGV